MLGIQNKKVNTDALKFFSDEYLNVEQVPYKRIFILDFSVFYLQRIV